MCLSDRGSICPSPPQKSSYTPQTRHSVRSHSSSRRPPRRRAALEKRCTKKLHEELGAAPISTPSLDARATPHSKRPRSEGRGPRPAARQLVAASGRHANRAGDPGVAGVAGEEAARRGSISRPRTSPAPREAAGGRSQSAKPSGRRFRNDGDEEAIGVKVVGRTATRVIHVEFE